MRVRYGRTFNLGNYETHHIELEVRNVKLEKADLVFQWLKAKVEEMHKTSKTAQQIGQEENINQEWLKPEEK